MRWWGGGHLGSVVSFCTAKLLLQAAFQVRPCWRLRAYPLVGGHSLSTEAKGVTH